MGFKVKNDQEIRNFDIYIPLKQLFLSVFFFVFYSVSLIAPALLCIFHWPKFKLNCVQNADQLSRSHYDIFWGN